MNNLIKSDLGKSERFSISTTTYHRSIFDLHRHFKMNKLTISDLNYRCLKRTKDQKTGLIESILLGIPLSPIYITEDVDGDLEIIAGIEALVDIFDYIDGRYELQNMNVLHSYSGAKFTNLPVGYQRKIGDYNIMSYILRVEADESSKVKIYQSINENLQNPPFSYHEKRRYAYYANHGINLANDLTINPKFKKIGFQTDKNMDEEIILSFISFYLKGYQSYNGKIDYFIDETLKNIENNQYYLEDIEELFIDTLETIYFIFDGNPFTMYSNKNKPNRALFDILMCSIATTNRNLILRYSYQIKNNLENLMKNEEFKKAISSKIYTKKAVQTRFKLWFETMKNYMED